MKDLALIVDATPAMKIQEVHTKSIITVLSMYCQLPKHLIIIVYLYVSVCYEALHALKCTTTTVYESVSGDIAGLLSGLGLCMRWESHMVAPPLHVVAPPLHVVVPLVQLSLALYNPPLPSPSSVGGWTQL